MELDLKILNRKLVVLSAGIQKLLELLEALFLLFFRLLFLVNFFYSCDVVYELLCKANSSQKFQLSQKGAEMYFQLKQGWLLWVLNGTMFLFLVVN